MSLNQRDDIAVVRSTDEVALPVARHSAILDRRRPFADRHCIHDLAVHAPFFRCMARAPEEALRSQISHQLLLQHAPRLHIKASIDGLVRHVSRLVCWMCPLQPTRDLFGRPVPFQFRSNSLPQLAAYRQLAELWAKSPFPRQLLGCFSPVAPQSAIAADLATDRRSGPVERTRDRSDRQTPNDAP